MLESGDVCMEQQGQHLKEYKEERVLVDSYQSLITTYIDGMTGYLQEYRNQIVKSSSLQAMSDAGKFVLPQITEATDKLNQFHAMIGEKTNQK